VIAKSDILKPEILKPVVLEEPQAFWCHRAYSFMS